MDYSSPIAIAVRRVGQQIGILRPLTRMYRRLRRLDYEDAFNASLFANISEGDVIWDVGANVGHYTARFASAAGPAGKVLAFEPSSRNAQILSKEMREYGNVRVETVALSDHSGWAAFYADPSADSAVDGLVPASLNAVESKVRVCRGDEFLEQCPPSKIKIDVEGFEKEVLDGMRETLHSATLKALFIEIHFQVLMQRGKATAPTDIVQMLRAEGFSVKWADPSHIIALRH